MQRLLDDLLKILGPFPEARAAVSKALLAQGVAPQEKAEFTDKSAAAEPEADPAGSLA
jgi:hypothetical protein